MISWTRTSCSLTSPTRPSGKGNYWEIQTISKVLSLSILPGIFTSHSSNMSASTPTFGSAPVLIVILLWRYLIICISIVTQHSLSHISGWGECGQGVCVRLVQVSVLLQVRQQLPRPHWLWDHPALAEQVRGRQRDRQLHLSQHQGQMNNNRAFGDVSLFSNWWMHVKAILSSSGKGPGQVKVRKVWVRSGLAQRTQKSKILTWDIKKCVFSSTSSA